jgi:serine/threonine-protein kinase RsbW
MDRPDEKPDVFLRVPADGAYVSVLRPEATSGGSLEAEFRQTPGTLTVSVRVETGKRAEPDYESFAWQVLSTLSTEATASADDDHLEVTFSADSTLALSEQRPVG